MTPRRLPVVNGVVSMTIFLLYKFLSFSLQPLKLCHTLPLPSATAADRWVFLEYGEEKNHGKIFNDDHEVLSFARYRMAPT